MSDQGWLFPQRGTRQVGIEKLASLLESVEQMVPIGEGLTLQDLFVPELMRPFGDGLIGGAAKATEF